MPRRLQFLYHPELPAKETYLSPGLYAYWVWCASELVAASERMEADARLSSFFRPLIHLLLLGFTVCQWIPRA